MRVFILCTGRSGSTTIMKACQHMSNYTASHESLVRNFGEARFHYPDNHIESDNKLSWHTGLLNNKFPKDVFYVHLKRNRDAVAKSYLKRFYQPSSTIDAFCEGFRSTPPEKLNKEQRLQACFDYVDTINANVAHFIKDKPNSMTIHIENINNEFPVFWEKIGAKGDLNKALDEFKIKHNASAKRKFLFPYRLKLLLLRIWKQIEMSMSSK